MAQGWGWELAGRPLSHLSFKTDHKGHNHNQDAQLARKNPSIFLSGDFCYSDDSTDLELSMDCYGNCNYFTATANCIQLIIKTGKRINGICGMFVLHW